MGKPVDHPRFFLSLARVEGTRRRALRERVAGEAVSLPPDWSLTTTVRHVWEAGFDRGRFGHASQKPDHADAIAKAVNEIQARFSAPSTTAETAGLVEAPPPPCYLMSEPHLSGYRVILGYETLDQSMDAQTALAKHFKGALR